MITTDRVRLVPMRGVEIRAPYLEALNDSETIRYMEAGRRPQTAESARAFLSGFSPPTGYVFRILTGVDVDVGNLTVRVKPTDQQADFGILVWRQWWGTGAAAAALEEATRWAWGRGLSRLTFWTHNPRAARLVARLGWTHEGTLRRNFLDNTGQWTDSELYARLREE